MDLGEGLPIEEPEVLVPWHIRELELREIVGAGALTRVSRGYFTTTCTLLGGLRLAVGFHFKYDPAIDQFAHPAVLTVLTPDGRVSRYLFGIEFAPVDLRLALVEAADHRIGSAIDQMLLFCYHYDPESGSYGFAITNLVRLGGVLTLLGLGTFILTNLRRERRQASAVSGTATGNR